MFLLFFWEGFPWLLFFSDIFFFLTFLLPLSFARIRSEGVCNDGVFRRVISKSFCARSWVSTTSTISFIKKTGTASTRSATTASTSRASTRAMKSLRWETKVWVGHGAKKKSFGKKRGSKCFVR